MSSCRRSCANNPDAFHCICREYTPKHQRKGITDFVKQSYFVYFDVNLGDQDKPWAPHQVCKTCVENLRLWKNGKLKGLRFGVPMVWRRPQNHHDDCYFCLVNIKGFNRYKKRKWEYLDLKSARRPVLHCESIPVPVFTSLPQLHDSDCEEPHALEQGWPSFLCKAPTLLPTRVGCAINVGQGWPTFSVHAPKFFATQAFI